MKARIASMEVFGFIRPSIDAHTMGIANAAKLLEQCGYKTEIGSSQIAIAVEAIDKLNNATLLKKWILTKKITRIGFSYRLDPKQAKFFFGKLLHHISRQKLLFNNGGQIKGLYFGGLPEACDRIKEEFGEEVVVFTGDETPFETLKKFGIPEYKMTEVVAESSAYDEERMSFGKKIIDASEYIALKPVNRYNYPYFGTSRDKVIDRIQFSERRNLLPLIRAHVGPYDPNYKEALKQFMAWLKILANAGYLDIASIGTSQLTQSHFGEDWKDMPNGGGVPINSVEEYRAAWLAARPMLVRTYAGTKNITFLAKMYEETINIAWHALSLWWFCQIDGRGPNSVIENLKEHFETLKFIAKSGKPFEPNVPHHFAFRGADDYTYVLSGYLAAKTAKKIGIKYFILQTMLNTPKYTWGIQDLAKSRALLSLVKELEDSNFKVYLQPRTGLDYFSPNLERAKIQLAAVTAMMDDIEPLNPLSPPIIHVVSYTEAIKLASPEIINESIKITLQALKEYRRLKARKKAGDLALSKEVTERTRDIVQETKTVIALIEKYIDDPYTPIGLYEIFKRGVMPVPYLWEARNEFMKAVSWNTALSDGGIKVVDKNNKPITPSIRIKSIFREFKV